MPPLLLNSGGIFFRKMNENIRFRQRRPNNNHNIGYCINCGHAIDYEDDSELCVDCEIEKEKCTMQQIESENEQNSGN